MPIPDIQKQKIEWKRKAWSIPELRGSKQTWYSLVVELIEQIANNPIIDSGIYPTLSVISEPYPWRTYIPFLKGVGLICNRIGMVSLSETGENFSKTPSKTALASMLHDKYRLFGETLALLQQPHTIDNVDQELCREFSLDWANLSNTRRRMDWLEILGMIQNVGNRQWKITDIGNSLLDEWLLVTPEATISPIGEGAAEITTPSPEIQRLLCELHEHPELHKKRNTYNVWVPSPNRIENLRTIVQFASERVSRGELFKFIEDEFQLKQSSVESMMPFMKADGLLEEVGRNTYVATTAAKAWCESRDDLDFVRIIHAHKRFVGELLVFAEQDRVRNDIYAEAKKYGINTEKTRWIIGFLLEASLLEEPQYLHVKTTPLGIAMANSLPLADATGQEDNSSELDNIEDIKVPSVQSKSQLLFDLLTVAARDPAAQGKAPGLAFEETIADVFQYMGFQVKNIGGAGDTDVIVRWKDDDGKIITAIVDGKSKSSGTVTHSDVSDVALETHREKNSADYVAIVGPSFTGDTIKNHAKKKGIALITDGNLIDIARNSQELGLSLSEISLLFKVPNGLTQLDELISSKKRELDIVTLVISTFLQEQESMDSLSARDLYFLLRKSSISPSLDELIRTFETLSKGEVSVLMPIKKTSSPENTTYIIHEERRSVNRLKAISSAIEKGLK